MNTAKPTKICAAPPQLGSTGATSRAERRPADHHARHFDVVERPPGERHRTRHAGPVVGRRIDVAERVRRRSVRDERQGHVDRADGCSTAPVNANVIAPVTLPARRQPAGGDDADRQVRRAGAGRRTDLQPRLIRRRRPRDRAAPGLRQPHDLRRGLRRRTSRPSSPHRTAATSCRAPRWEPT